MAEALLIAYKAISLHSCTLHFRHLPSSQQPFNFLLHFRTRFFPFMTARQKRVVPSLGMTQMSNHSKSNHRGSQTLGCRRPTDATTVFGTGVLCDAKFSTRRTSRKNFTHARCKELYIFLFEFCSALRFTFSAPRACLTILQTFLFCLFQCLRFDKQTLSFIAFAGATPL